MGVVMDGIVLCEYSKLMHVLQEEEKTPKIWEQPRLQDTDTHQKLWGFCTVP